MFVAYSPTMESSFTTPSISTPADTPANSSSASDVFLCGICHKPFLSECSRNRHVAYCRRTQSRPRARQRSCQACSVAKAKCTFQATCSRCARKGIDCVYKASALAGKSGSQRSVVTNTTKQSDEPQETIVSADMESSMSSNYMPDDRCIFDNGMEWNDTSNPFQSGSNLLKSPAFEIANFADEVISHSSAGFPAFGAEKGTISPPDTSFSLRTLFNTGPHHQTATVWSAWTTGDPYFPALTVPMNMSILTTSGLLSKSQLSNPVARSNAEIVIQMLRAFPRMMARRETFPAFIHPLSEHTSRGGLPEPLANCISIAQMMFSQTGDNKKFLWQTIAREQIRIQDDFHQFSKQELLAAIQASIIYLIMRVADNPPQNAGFDLQMLVSFQMMCEHLRKLCGQPFCQDEQAYPSSSWEDWIFAESRRRVACLWFIIGRIFCVCTGIPCDTSEGYLALPLPSTKSLWEANTSLIWQSEYQRFLLAQKTAIRSFGELINAHQRAEERKLDTWNSGIDNLGMLLSLSVAML